MGREKAFLVPVCIDATSENDADVPDSFVSVRWTRLPAGNTPDAFAKRLQALLAGETIAGRSAPRSAPPPSPAISAPSAPPPRRTLWQWLVPAFVAVAAVAAVFFWHRRSSGSGAPAENLPPEAALDIAKTRQLISNVNYGREDLSLAEGFMAKATEAAPDSAQVWALRGLVQATYILRTWDIGKDRQRDAQTYCQKALALDPNSPEAMLGLAYVFDQTGAFADSEALMRKALPLAPDDPRYPRILGVAAFNGDSHAAGIAILRETGQRFPKDPLTWYDVGLHEWYDHRYAEALESYRRVVALAPMAGAYIAMAELLCLQGDLAGANAAIAKIPVEARSGDRAVGIDMWLGILERNPNRVLTAEGRTSVEYFTDAQFREPKAFLTALAYQIAGKENLAAHEWDKSIAILRQRLKETPNELDEINLGIALVKRGRADEAAQEVDAIAAAQREMDAPTYPSSLARYYAAKGDAAQAVAYLRKLPHGDKIEDAVIQIEVARIPRRQCPSARTPYPVTCP